MGGIKFLNPWHFVSHACTLRVFRLTCVLQDFYALIDTYLLESIQYDFLKIIHLWYIFKFMFSSQWKSHLLSPTRCMVMIVLPYHILSLRPILAFQYTFIVPKYLSRQLYERLSIYLEHAFILTLCTTVHYPWTDMHSYST